MALSNPLLIVLLSLSTSTGVKASCAPPDCNANVPVGDPPYFHLADPRNCHKYYICYNEEGDGDDTYFITGDSFWCEDPDDVFSEKDDRCGDYTCVESCSGTCAPYECIDLQDKRADPYDCTKYHTCPDGKTVQCEGDKPFFDGDQCQADESKCCHCKPYCSQGQKFKNVPDPLDCKSYYFCVNEHEFPTSRTTCTIGNFDMNAGKCDESAPCIVTCKNVVGCDGCIGLFTCEQYGNWPKCPHRCDPHFYHCGEEDIGHVVQESACASPLVYNPATEKCVAEEECPYDPPSQC
ncbi:peritrophin-44 [Penaeus vannamei]|uniref:peritrophin-44 n=1 Tax=Penaeus vannamei TaxID=6689 RepID=UPI00387F406F